MSRHSAHNSGAAKMTAAVITVVVLVVAVFGMTAYYLTARTPDEAVAPGQPVTLEIPEGANTQRIAELLEEAGVIDNAAAFRLKARTEESDGKLRAGSYDLLTGMPADDVLAKLTAGPVLASIKVTIPEGWRLTQIAARLEKEAGIPGR